MSDSSTLFRIWIAGTNEWLPGPQFESLDQALTNAHTLAVSGEVAIELPTRHWHTFPENGEQFLGPDHAMAKGSQTDLADRADKVLSTESRSYTLSLAKIKPVARPAVATTGAISLPHVSTPNGQDASQPAVADRPGAVLKPAAPTNERRDGSRFEASLILAEPTCSIETKRTEILDVSESGLRIAIPAGVQATASGRLILVFSGRHGFFELDTLTCWADGYQAGVRLADSSTNLVGRMFLRKMIAKWRERERRRAKMKNRK